MQYIMYVEMLTTEIVFLSGARNEKNTEPNILKDRNEVLEKAVNMLV